MKPYLQRKSGRGAIPASLAAGLALTGSAMAGTYSANFATLPTGATIYGDGTSSGIIEDGILKLTLNVGSMQGGFVIDDLDAGQSVTGFTATFKLLIGGGSGADGFSFNFGSDLPDSALPEEGGGTGLTIVFDTYDNGGGEAPAIDIKKGGVVIASAKGLGAIFRSNTLNDVRVNVDNDGSLDLSVGSTVVYSNLLGAFASSPGRFSFGARTGGSADNHWIDDVNITTRLDAPSAPVALSAAPQGTEVTPAAVVKVQIQDLGTQVNQASVKLKFDGSDVTPSISKAGAITTVEFDPPGLLPPRSKHVVLVSFTDNANPPKAQEITYEFTVPDYKSLPPFTKVTPNTSKPGFLFNVFANGVNQTTSNARAEDAVNRRLKAADGSFIPNLADISAQGIAIAPAPALTAENATARFEIDTVINMSQNGGDNAGNWTTDDVMPGIPATDGSTDGIAAEIITYIELPAGAVTMGVNSDDGFRTSAGVVTDAFGNINLGEFDGGRGAADTLYTFVVEEAGVYPFRTIWEEGGGGANVEWFTVKADGTKVLLNDTANGGFKTYRAITSPTPVAVKAVSPEPVPRQVAGTASALTITLADGSAAQVDAASVALKVDGKPVTVTPSRAGSEVTLTYQPTGLLLPSESHTAELSFKDTAGNNRTQSWSFRNLKKIVVPAPSVTENFDSMPDGKVPTGWNAWNFTATCGDGALGEDPASQTSDTYKNWVVTTIENVRNVDGDRVFNVAPGQAINDTLIDTPEKLFSGNVIYAESDSRCNTSTLTEEAGWNGQTQFIISKPFNLSALTKGVILTLSSIYEQNQDSYGGIEYSVDGGNTFLPLAYFLDGPDVALNPDGTTDAVTTFTRANTDTSAWVDKGVAKGGKFGDGVGAPITAALGDYITPRVNDDTVEGKRVEIFRLPAATGKSDVRLRFSAMGTDSWYFAIDNIAFYDVAGAVTGPGKLNAPTISGGNAVISWTGAGTLQQATSITGPWTAAASQANPQNVPVAGATAMFFRLSN